MRIPSIAALWRIQQPGSDRCATGYLSCTVLSNVRTVFAPRVPQRTQRFRPLWGGYLAIMRASPRGARTCCARPRVFSTGWRQPDAWLPPASHAVASSLRATSIHRQPPSEALPGEHRQLWLRRVQPARMLGALMELELRCEPAHFGRREALVEGGCGTRVQVVEHDVDAGRVREGDIDQVLQDGRSRHSPGARRP